MFAKLSFEIMNESLHNSMFGKIINSIDILMLKILISEILKYVLIRSYSFYGYCCINIYTSYNLIKITIWFALSAQQLQLSASF